MVANLEGMERGWERDRVAKERGRVREKTWTARAGIGILRFRSRIGTGEKIVREGEC